MAASSSRGRSRSPFHLVKPSSSYSSTSSSSSFVNGRLMQRSCSSSATSFYGGSGNGAGGGAYGSRSMTPGGIGGDRSRRYSDRSPVGFPLMDEQLIGEPLETTSRSGDSILVTIRFRPLSDREYQRGDEIAWYAGGDKIVRNEYNPTNAYGFDRVFRSDASTPEVYDVAARPVVKAAMEGVNGTVFAYGVTSSGKTHTMHGDQSSPGIIPLAIKDVFSIIQDTPGREFLLRVSYLEIYNEVINDLLDPTGQNLRVREDAQGTYVEGIKEEVVLSPGHALSFIAAGEEHRHVGSNNFNLFSSRSHTIFTLMIESSVHGDEYDGVIFSQLNLIDLAGSESSKAETTGLRRKEGSYINKSLLTLGTVIGKLSEGKSSHVPYRDSKLTRLLQSSLSGHGHVSLICTVTPASSNMEETHNTLKFASRAKRVEIHAAQNKIIDEKSLIKKYQREISSLKEELDQLKRGGVAGINHEEVLTLRQRLEEGQVKMQSRLEEEEDAKAALLSRIQRLTKLILVSSKNNIPGYTSDAPSHQRSRSTSEDDKLDVIHDGSLMLDGENKKNLLSSDLALLSDINEFKHRRSSSKWNDDISQAGSTISETTLAGELISGSSCVSKLPIDREMMSDQIDLLVEQVKMLAGEIAFGSSTLKRLLEQSVNDPEGSKTQIQNLEHEIQEKQKQMRVLEQRIVESGEASVANASMVEMQQTVMKLMAQSSEKGFELEIKSADNRVLQEQLQNKCVENKELLEKFAHLEQQLASVSSDKVPSASEQCVSDEFPDELRKKMQSQEIENEKLKLEHVQILEENSGLRVQNLKLSEEASYAKELAAAAAVELKNLAGEVTRMSVHNAKLEKDLQAARELNSRGGNRKNIDVQRTGRRGRLSDRASDVSTTVSGDFESWNLDLDVLKLDLQARKQREAALEGALSEKEILEDEYRSKIEEAKKREASLENDLANMWVLVAQLKKEGNTMQELKITHPQNEGTDRISEPKAADVEWRDQFLEDKHNEEKDQIREPKAADVEWREQILEDRDASDVSMSASTATKDEPLVARMLEIKENQLRYTENGDGNSHVCKICFETPAAAMLLPCRHFCLCESCSLACSECPICRTKIVDRIFAFT
ncbi:kinesin-like protein KIN-7D, mitochondrial isoform X2 [Henckelia pumila]|uniref:kinesin-like protein KIN-7D, mitochondrial isoform X2 n=1 Tax=Henckelia pumila TaxID=405737 RepID=UPI003C6DD184